MVRFIITSVLVFTVLSGFDGRIFACGAMCGNPENRGGTAAIARSRQEKEKNRIENALKDDVTSVESVRFLSNTANLKSEIQGTWSVQKIETSEQSLNAMIQDSDFSNILIEFTKSGSVLVLGKATGTKYRVENNKIILSEGLAKNITHPEAKASIKSGKMTVNLTAALVKQILLTVKDRYVESGGEAFIAKLIENIAQTHSIEAVITFKRK
jgi:hypothetical protein